MTTLSTAARNAACDAIVDLVDDGTGAGNLIIRASDDAEISTHAMSATAFGAAGAVNPGEAVADAIADDNDATGGTAAKFTLEDGDDVVVISGTAGTTGDLVLNTATIGAGAKVSITALTVTVPASA